jgi:RNA polymerase sigma factor (sigma-70 family)
MDAEELFMQSVALIEKIAVHVGRRNGLRNDDVAEFAAEAKFRLIENDYAIIRKFEGRSSFSTYLTTVVTRLFYQRRVEEWGKWRPSAEARRLGLRAIALEQLITRDGHPFPEAAQILLSRAGAGYTLAELEAIWRRLPPRQPRPMMVPEEPSSDTAGNARADDPLMAREREQTACTASRVIDRVISSFPPEDQLILRLRFWEACKVPAIAARLHLDQKKIYKRLDKLFAGLRRALAEAGVQPDDVAELLDAGDSEVTVDISALTAASPGFSQTGPSHMAQRDQGDGGGRISQ